MKQLFVSIFILILLPTFVVNAQITSNIGGEGVHLKTNPVYPEPYQTFTVTVDDYSSIERVTNIAWRVDGESLNEAANLRNINVATKAAGKTTLVEAILTFTSGRTQTLTKSVTPRYLDIIVEAQTRTPAFYLGRSLPSHQSVVNLTALLSNSSATADDLLYTWFVNNTVVGGGAVRGRNKTSVITPAGSTFLISLEVSNLSGEILARRTISVPSVTPSMHFYEKSSLYGISNRTIQNINLTGDSVTMQAEPYNLAIETYNYPDLVEWKINGTTVQNPNLNPYEITLTAENRSFSDTTIDFHVRNTSQLLQGARGQFNLNF